MKKSIKNRVVAIVFWLYIMIIVMFFSNTVTHQSLIETYSLWNKLTIAFTFTIIMIIAFLAGLETGENKGK